MNEAPRMLYANRLEDIELGGGYEGILFHKIEPADERKYEFILAVHFVATEQTVMFVSSEVNKDGSEQSGDSHVMVLFPGEGHESLGASNDWADVRKFKNEAARVAVDRLGIIVEISAAAGSCGGGCVPTEH